MAWERVMTTFKSDPSAEVASAMVTLGLTKSWAPLETVSGAHKFNGSVATILYWESCSEAVIPVRESVVAVAS